MKTTFNSVNDDLLVKYMLGEASEQEQQEVLAWIAADEANARYFEHFKLIWDRSKQVEAQSEVNESEAWDRFKQRLATQPRRRTALFPMPSSPIFRIAAVFILLVGGGWLLYNYLSHPRVEMIAVRATEQPLTDTLPDGSVITLNRLSSITYPSRFDGNTRTVQLQGEAFFNVTPDKQKPFIVDANGVIIRVVGTSFNVKSSAGKTEVIVETGRVEVSRQQFKVLLTPHEKATVSADQPEPVKEINTDKLYSYYRTKEFVCNGTPLNELVSTLNEAYGTHIVIANPRLKHMPLTTTFRNQPIDSILSVISETFSIEVEKKGEEVILK